MPTYEYVCSKCEHRFEIFQSIKAKALTICPKELCPQNPWGKGPVKRVISAGAGLIFKGSGFYCTDYRSESYKAGAKKEAQSAKPTPAPSGEKSGTSDAAKSAPAPALAGAGAKAADS